MPARTFSRRQLLAATGLSATAALFATQLHLPFRRPAAAEAFTAPHNLAWVWQLETDSALQDISAKLSAYGLGVLLKTHDGTKWMAEFDPSPFAANGPAQVAVLASYFEGKDVPFHAWTVLKGQDPLLEAQMASQVLSAGARTLLLNVQAKEGFWSGSSEAARTFGEELRRQQPDATVILGVDPRPWRLNEAPVTTFAGFVNGIAPLHFWPEYDTEDERDRFASAGFAVPEEGITPEFLSGVSTALLAGFGHPLMPVAESAAVSPALFSRFVAAAEAAGAPFVSAWRYGDLTEEHYSLLARRREPEAAPPSRTHVIAPGETLSGIAAEYDVSTQDLIAVNQLADPDNITAGAELRIP